MNLLDYIVKHDKPITSEELASLSGGEALLISTIYSTPWAAIANDSSSTAPGFGLSESFERS